MITTTIILCGARIDMLLNASITLGISQSCIVSKLIKRMYLRNNRKLEHLSRVKYQDRITNAEWTRLHLRISPEMYQKCLDLRKLFKKSVSRLFAEELDNSLNDIIREILSGKTRDNYQDSYFIFHQKDDNGHNYKVYNTYQALMSDAKT